MQDGTGEGRKEGEAVFDPGGVGDDAGPPFFPVSEQKLTRLYLLTFGLYAIVWSYQHWRRQKPFMRRRIIPALRGFFYVFFIWQLFRRMAGAAGEQGIDSHLRPGFHGALFIVLFIADTAAGQWLEDPAAPRVLGIAWVAMFIFSAYPLQVAQETANQVIGDPLGLGNSRYGTINWLFMAAGAVLWLVVLYGVFMQSTGVVARIAEERVRADERMAALVVGSWAVDPRDPEFDGSGGVSTYHADGRLDYAVYADDCESPEMTVFGEWLVEDGRLELTVTASSHPQDIPPGARSTDRIVSIDRRHKVLESVPDGTLQYRLRSERCVQPAG